MLMPVHNPVDAFWKISVDDKTSVPVGRKVPIASVQNQSIRACVLLGASIEAADHSWCCEKLVPSVIQVMNNSPYPEDSHFSSRGKGNGRTFVSIHDATLDPSSGLSLLFFLVDKSNHCVIF